MGIPFADLGICMEAPCFFWFGLVLVLIGLCCVTRVFKSLERFVVGLGWVWYLWSCLLVWVGLGGFRFVWGSSGL